MLDEFSFLIEEEAKEIVVENPNKIADMIEEIEVIIETGGIPFAPIIEDSQMTVTNMVYDKAKEWYGNPLPFHIETRFLITCDGSIIALPQSFLYHFPDIFIKIITHYMSFF